MALTGLEIFKKLPKTNCRDCGYPTCLAFAMKLAAGQESLDKCPHVSEEAKAALAEASAPPIRLVTVGIGDKAISMGEEQVLFRHEKRFFHETALGILIEDSYSDEEIEEKIRQLESASFERVGQTLGGNFVALRSVSDDPVTFKSLAQKVDRRCNFPLVLISSDEEVMAAGLSAVGNKKPLVHAATAQNHQAFVALAKNHGCPLAVYESEGLDKLADLVEKVKALGVQDLVLDPGSPSLKDSLRDLVYMRRSALLKKFRPLGFPVITEAYRFTEDSFKETLVASIHLCKYASMVILRSMESWKMFPLLILRQNIFTDPQKPMQVEEKIYDIGDPDENSPVLVSTNFSLTYFIVSGEIEASKVPTWLMLMDSEGQSVLTAWAAGKFIPEKIAPFVKKSGIAERVSHRNLVIPGYVAQISGELQAELEDQGWRVIVGPREAADIPRFLQEYKFKYAS